MELIKCFELYKVSFNTIVKRFKYIIIAIAIVLFPTLMAVKLIDVFGNSNLYHLDLSDASTYTCSCKSIVDGKFFIENNSCELTTSVIAIPGDTTSHIEYDLPISFHVYSSIQANNSDKIQVYYRLYDEFKLCREIVGADIKPQSADYSFTLKKIKAGSDIELKIVVSARENMILGIDKYFTVGTPVIAGTKETYKPVKQFLYEYMEAIDKSDKVIVNWTTLYEKDLIFSIQKSRDGISFFDLGKVNGHSSQEMKLQYSFTDTTSIGSKVVYYRIKHTYTNGESGYSEVMAFQRLEEFSRIINNNRVPCIGKCEVMLNELDVKNGNVYIAVFDVFGNAIKAKIESVRKDREEEIKVNKDNYLQPVFYIRKINTGKEVIEERIEIEN